MLELAAVELYSINGLSILRPTEEIGPVAVHSKRLGR
jgi:hypothetical protein